MKPSFALVLLFVSVPFCCAVDKVPRQAPVVRGVMARNTGCILFAESFKSRGRILGVAVNNQSGGKLTVIETQNYTFDEKEVLETQPNMDALTLRAERRASS